MKSILKNSNGNAVSTNGKLITVSNSIKLQEELENAKAMEDFLVSGVGDITTYSNDRVTKIKEAAFKNVTSLTSVYFPNVTYIEGMYSFTNTGLIEITDEHFPKLTQIDWSFSECKELKKVELSKLEHASSACTFYNCTKLEIVKLPLLKTIGSQVFQNTAIKEVNFPNVFSCGSATFKDCTKLETAYLPALNQYSSDIFVNTTNLTILIMKKLERNLQIGSGTTWGHLLTLDTLINLVKELVKKSSSRTLTMGSANLEKLQDVYVRLTGEPEENTSKPKLPCEVCGSTDEGAMSIIAYANLKNWTLA